VEVAIAFVGSKRLAYIAAFPMRGREVTLHLALIVAMLSEDRIPLIHKGD